MLVFMVLRTFCIEHNKKPGVLIIMFRQNSDTLKRKWVEYLFEVVAIIAGLLLAFMLDSWHEERQNRKEEQQILLGLRDEFAANLEAVDRDIRINEHLPMVRVDQYLDFSQWSEQYKHQSTPPGDFPIPVDELNLMQLENIIWHHKFNQDFNVLNSIEIRSFLETTLSMIERNISG